MLLREICSIVSTIVSRKRLIKYSPGHQALLDAQLLTEKEIDIYKRGRNANSQTKAKNTDVVTYKVSTGFEAVIGYLHMTEQIERLEELVNWCIAYVDNQNTKKEG